MLNGQIKPRQCISTRHILEFYIYGFCANTGYEICVNFQEVYIMSYSIVSVDIGRW